MRTYLHLQILFTVSFLYLIINGCQFIVNEPSQIVINSEYIQLAWDPPDINEKDVYPVISYGIFYRIHGMKNWELLDIIPASRNPTYTIYHSKLGNGLFDFAVGARTTNFQISKLHSSLDLTADPLGGWYIIWLRFED